MSKQSKKEDARYLAALRDPRALVDGWKCPCCGNEFRDQYACPHGWDDVRKSNDQLILRRARR